MLRDLSTNGVLVNGTRISGSQLLARADVVRVGSEDFRFYADVPTPAIDIPAVPASARSATDAPVEAKARHSHPAPVAPPDTVRERGLPVWVWVLAAALIGAGAYFVLQGR
jgi:hypothetical protein